MSGKDRAELLAIIVEDMGPTVETMIPAEHSILKEAATGRILQIGNYSYVAESGIERSAIREFIALCRTN